MVVPSNGIRQSSLNMCRQEPEGSTAKRPKAETSEAKAEGIINRDLSDGAENGTLKVPLEGEKDTSGAKLEEEAGNLRQAQTATKRKLPEI